MRQNNKHLDQNEVAAVPVQTDGQTAAGCTDDKANAVMNEFMSIFLYSFIFYIFFPKFIYYIFRDLDQAWIYSSECDIQHWASPKCKEECSTQKRH